MTRYLIQKTEDSPHRDSVVHSLLRMGLYIRHSLQQGKRHASKQMGHIRGLWQSCVPGLSAALYSYKQGKFGGDLRLWLSRREGGSLASVDSFICCCPFHSLSTARDKFSQ